MRRKNSAGAPVTYAAVGMTQQSDILAFPPSGFRGQGAIWRIGSGAERFSSASDALFTWGLQRAAHLEVKVLEDGDPAGYTGIEFTAQGIARLADGLEDVPFSSDGTPYLQPGSVVQLGGLWTPVEDEHIFRVIYVVRETRRVGFALGTLDEGPVIGEEFFGLEWRDDDTVWAFVRSVTSIPESRWRAVLVPLIRLRQKLQLRSSVRALSPARQG